MRGILCCIGLVLAPLLHAQILDTSDTHLYKPLNTYSVSERGLDLLQEDSVAMDTQLIGFNRNYPLLLQGPFLDLGYEGSPALLLDVAPMPTLALDPGLTAYDPYRYDLQLHRYHTDRPFTRLHYSQGQNELIYVEAQHGQQFSERLALGLDYRRIKNHNFYYSDIRNVERVKFTDLFNTKLYTGYHSADRSYELLAGYVWNKNDQTLSGGLVRPDDFEIAGISKNFNHAARLTNAQSQFHEHRFKVKQYFRYSAAALDSARPYSLERFRAQWVSENQLTKTTYGMQDQAPDSTYYGDSIGIYTDTLQHLQFIQAVGHQWMGREWTVYTGLRYAFDQIRMAKLHQLYHSSYAVLMAHYAQWELQASYGLSGYNRGDHQLSVSYRWKAGSWDQEAVLDRQGTQPYFFRQQLRFGPHDWKRDFNRSTYSGLRYTVTRPLGGFRMRGTMQIGSQNGLVYLTDSGSQQSQEAVSLSLIQLGLNREWHYFGMQLKGSYQSSSAQNVLPRPEWYGSGRIYVQLRLFHHKLLTQWGTEAYTFSSFSAPVYRADMIGWSNQGASLPSYTPISVFVNAKVKNFNFGLCLYHISQGLLGEAYYSSPYYPVMPRVMRFNVRWDLSN